MTRKKVTLGWIVSDNARRASLKKRRTGLIKKVSDLSILCGVTACAIIYSPNEIEPIFFPPSQSEVEEILLRYKRVPDMEKNRKMMNQESYLKDRTTKYEDQLRKNLKKNRDMEMNHLLHQIHNARKPYNEFPHTDLHGLRVYMEERWQECRRRIQFFHQTAASDQIPLLGGDNKEIMEDARGLQDDTIQRDPWFIKMRKNGHNIVVNSNDTDKAKVLSTTYEGSSNHATATFAPYNKHMESGNMWGNEGTLFHGNMGNQYGVFHDFKLSQLGQTGDMVDDHIASLVSHGSAISYGMLEPHYGQNDVVVFGHNMGNSHHGFMLPYPDSAGGRSNSISNPSQHHLNIGGGERGHAMIPLHGGIQGMLNSAATDTKYGTIFPDPYEDFIVPTILNGMKGYDTMPPPPPHEDAAANKTSVYGSPNFFRINTTQGSQMGHVSMIHFPVGGDGRSVHSGGYEVESDQGNNIVGDRNTNLFLKHMSMEGPRDPWDRYYSTGEDSSGTNNTLPKRDAQNKFSS